MPRRRYSPGLGHATISLAVSNVPSIRNFCRPLASSTRSPRTAHTPFRTPVAHSPTPAARPKIRVRCCGGRHGESPARFSACKIAGERRHDDVGASHPCKSLTACSFPSHFWNCFPCASRARTMTRSRGQAHACDLAPGFVRHFSGGVQQRPTAGSGEFFSLQTDWYRTW